jgi:hypothetical protein
VNLRYEGSKQRERYTGLEGKREGKFETGN